MGWYLGVILKLHSDIFMIYIFTDEVLNGIPNMFTNLQYHCWYKYFRNTFLSVLVNNTHDNVHFLNQIHMNIPRSGKKGSKNNRLS